MQQKQEKSGRMKLALFDLDHTLLPIDSDYSWGVFTSKIGWVEPESFNKRNDEFYEHYKAGTLDINDYVRFATDAVRMQGAQSAAMAHAQFMSEVIEPALMPNVHELVEAHREQGDRIIIVTATNEFVTEPIARMFDADDLIAVRLERDADGWITGNIDGVPSAREGKVTRMEQWLAEHNLGWGDVETTFYTDSINDLALLEKVDHPVATNPDDRLRAIATSRGWRILDLFKKIT